MRPGDLSTAQARKIVQPKKPQPSKLPPTLDKPNISNFHFIPEPQQQQQQAQGPPSFGDFLGGLFGQQQDQAPPPDFATWAQQFLGQQQNPQDMASQFLAPIMQQYQTLLAQQQQQAQGQNQFTSTLTDQLVGILKGQGSDIYTPELAAALAAEANRENQYNQGQQQQQLFQGTIGDAQQQIPSLIQQYLQQSQPSIGDMLNLRQEYNQEFSPQGGLSPSDTLQALGAYNSTYGSPYQNAKDAQTQALAQQKATDDYNIKAAALKQLGKYRSATVTAKQNDQKIALANARTSRQRAIDSYNTKAAALKETARYHNMTATQRAASLKSLQKSRDAQVAQANQRIKIAQQNANTAATRAANAGKGKGKVNLATLAKMADGFYSGKPVSVTVNNPHYGKPFNDGRIDKKATITQTQNANQLRYDTAFKRLTSAGASRTQAAKLVNARYKRGESGRPWLDRSERTVLLHASTRAGAFKYKGYGYLNDKQVEALKAANALPPGTYYSLNGRRVYVIAAAYE